MEYISWGDRFHNPFVRPITFKKCDKHYWVLTRREDHSKIVCITCFHCLIDAPKEVYDSYSEYRKEEEHKEYIEQEAHELWLFDDWVQKDYSDR